MSRILTLTGLLLVLAAPFLSPVTSVVCADGGDAGRIKVRAELFGDASIRAVATFRQHQTGNGAMKKKLHVKLKHAAPFHTYMVRINSRPAGVITTNPAGNGKLKINNPNMPTIRRRFDITVGPLSGVFYETSTRFRDRIQRFRVRTDLEGDVDTTGAARYIERYKNRKLRRDFVVTVTDAPPNRTVAVKINGVTKARLTTNDDGEGRVHLRTAEFIRGNECDGDDGDESNCLHPMSDDFPSILPGFTIDMGPLSGEFERPVH